LISLGFTDGLQLETMEAVLVTNQAARACMATYYLLM
jgi:hypothetical protein